MFLMDLNMSFDSKMDWSKDLVFEFLDIYESEPAIWNPQHASHKNRKDVFDAWCRIQKKMSNRFSIDELKRKKESLMATYRTLVQKIRKSIEHGGFDVYQPNWFAFEKMAKFLNEREPRRRFIKIESVELQSNSDDYFEYEDNFDDSRTNFDNSVNDLNDTSDPPPSSTQEISVKQSDNLQQPSSTKKRKHEVINEDDKIIDHTAPVISTSTITKNHQKDECVMYGELIAFKLQKMDELTRDIAMNKIDNIIFELKMKSYHRQDSTSNSATSTNL